MKTTLNHGSVLLPWMNGISYMQQSVLLAAIRGPDGIRKDHPVKVLCRWLRRGILISAFEGIELVTPWEKGGGSFTGPLDPDLTLDIFVDSYLRTIDELPHHFQLHIMHAAEILGYKHPRDETRNFWNRFYLEIVNDAHLRPETYEEMEARLGDSEEAWSVRERAKAK